MRLKWMDSLKGITIILVVLGHLSPPPILKQYIFSFHMPLFFFISGYLFKNERRTNREILKQKFNSLIIPYLWFMLLGYTYYYILDLIYQPSIKNFSSVLGENIVSTLYWVIYSASVTIPVNSALWFLTCLFTVEIIFYNILRISNGRKETILSIIILFSVIGYSTQRISTMLLPWNLNIALTAIVFYSAGYFFRNNLEGIFIKNINYLLPLMVTLATLFFQKETDISMYYLRYGNYFSFYISAFSNILMYIYIFKKINNSNVLEFYGRNSIIILGFHPLIVFTIENSWELLFGKIPHESILFSLLFTFLTLLIIIPLIVVINRNFPFVIGKKK